MWFRKKTEKNNSLTIVVGDSSILRSTRGSDSLFTVSSITGKNLPIIGKLPLIKQYQIIGGLFLLFLIMFVTLVSLGSYKKTNFQRINQELSGLINNVQTIKSDIEAAKDGDDNLILDLKNKKEGLENGILFFSEKKLTNLNLNGAEENQRVSLIINDWNKGKQNWNNLEGITDYIEIVKIRSFENQSILEIQVQNLNEIVLLESLNNEEKLKIKKAISYINEFLIGVNTGGFNANNVQQIKNFVGLIESAEAMLLDVNIGGLQGRIDNAIIGIKEFRDLILPASKKLIEALKMKDMLLTTISSNLDATNYTLTSFMNYSRSKEEASVDYYYLGGVCFVLLILTLGLAWILYVEDNKRKTKEANDMNAATQQAIFAIVEEIESLGDGDLQVRATVTEDITGTIADAINYAITEMADLVKKIQKTSDEITSSTRVASTNARQLQQANKELVEAVHQVRGAVKNIAESISKVEKRISDSKQVAKASVESSSKGLEAVNASMQGMKAIEENVVETGRRIERLTLQSNQISEVVDLIRDISEKTSVLAINATVQASKAGSAGKGFQVVADSVQDLASQAAKATRRIGSLVQAVQTDINGAGLAMERTKDEARNGVKVAETTGEVLAEINDVSRRLSEIVEDLNEQVGTATQSVVSVSETMLNVADATSRANEATHLSNKSILQINDQAESLKDSVTRFRV